MPRRRSFVVLALSLLLVMAAGTARAAWVPISSPVPAPLGVSVREGTPERTVVEFTLPGYELTEVMVNGESCAAITVPGESEIMRRGDPQLPMLRRSVVVDDRMPIAVRLLEVESDTVATARVMPSRGHLDRNTDPSTVPWEFGPVYGSHQYWPAAAVENDEPFVVRAFRGVTVELHPFRYDPADGRLIVFRRAVVEIARGDGPATNPLSDRPAGDDGTFEALYRGLFVNYGAVAPLLYTPVHEPGRLVILTADAYYNDVLPLYRWKLQSGRPAILARISEVGSTASAIRTYLQGLYSSAEGLTYAVLVGDVADIPTMNGTYEGAASDPCYGMVTPDRYPDFLVSRLSVTSSAQAANAVTRTIRYERDPDTGAAGLWYEAATGVASNESGGTPYFDWQRMDFLRTDLLTYGYDTVDRVYDPGASRATLSADLNAGRSLVNYIGHGSTTGWGTTGYSVSDVHALTNGNQLPFVIDVACDNGKFTSSECFAEAWLRSGSTAAPAGGIGIYASSTLASWVPPCDMQTEMVDILVTDASSTMGGLCECGAMKVLDRWGSGPGSEGVKLVEQYNIFGDASLLLRTRTPIPLSVSHAPGVSGLNPVFELDLPGVAGALCALYDQGTLYGYAYTDASGHGVITLVNPPAVPGNMTLTVTAHNAVPYVVTLPYTLVTGPYLVCLGEAIDDDAGGGSDGDGDGFLDAGERPELDFSVCNLGTDTAAGTTATISTVSPWVDLIRAEASLGDIAAGDTAVVNDSLVFAVHADCPDGTVIPMTLRFASTTGEWTEDLSFVNHAAVLSVASFEVSDPAPGGDNDGIAEPGEDVRIAVRLANEGSGNASGVAGRLASGVVVWAAVTGDSAGIGEIPAGGSGVMTPDFTLHVTGDAPEMALVPMSLAVTGGWGLGWEAATSLAIGGIRDDVEAGSGDWTHAVVTPGFSDQWHRSLYYNHTPGGRWAWRFGNAIEGPYASRADGALVSGSFPVAAGTVLIFWYCIDADTCAGSPGYAWDGGVVEISVGGGAWQQLAPEGGYPYRIRNGAVPGPFAADTPCYSGTFGWRQASFDLGVAGAGEARVRFRFGSDGATGRDGWVIDDLRVTGGELPATGVAADPAGGEGAGAIAGHAPAAIYLGPGRPNPFRPSTEIEFGLPGAAAIDLAVYDVAGRRVKTLASGVLAAGVHVVRWDGRDYGGAPVAAGMYYCRLTAGGEVLARAMVRMR